MRTAVRLFLPLTATLLAVTACKKGDGSMTSAAPKMPTAQTQAETSSTNAQALPKLDTSDRIEQIPAGVESAKKMMASHRLTDAVVALLKQNMDTATDAQLQAHKQAMRSAQRMVADAFAAGDPDAQQAAELLRAYSSHSSRGH